MIPEAFLFIMMRGTYVLNVVTLGHRVWEIVPFKVVNLKHPSLGHKWPY